MYITLPKGKGRIVKKYWSKGRLKTRGADPNSASPCLKSRLSSDLCLCLACSIAVSFSWVVHTWSAGTPWLWHVHPVGAPCRDTPDTCLALASLPSCEGDSRPLSYTLDSEVSTVWLKLPSFSACWGWNVAHISNYIFVSSFLFMISLTAYLSFSLVSFHKLGA